jgi:hypothetical protein
MTRDPRTDPQPGDVLIIPKGSGVNAGRYVVDDRWAHDLTGVVHVGYTAASGFVGCTARYDATVDQWAEWMVGAVVPMTTTRIPAGEFVFDDGLVEITVPFEPGDLTFEPVAPAFEGLADAAGEAAGACRSFVEAYKRGLAPLAGVPFTAPEKPLDLSGSFTANLRAVTFPNGSTIYESVGSKQWIAATPYTLTVTVTYNRARNPPIGELRRWARGTSCTPWRCRSIASWRWLWRRTMLDTRSATFENVVIKPGTDTLYLRTEGRVNYDVVMYGRHA